MVRAAITTESGSVATRAPADTHVVVLGASPKPERYANMAQRLLMERGYRVTPVHPKIDRIEGLPVAGSLAEVEQPVHTLTLYVGPVRLAPLVDGILALAPERVIFNPGTELPSLQQRLEAAGIEWLEACTLVMLRTSVF